MRFLILIMSLGVGCTLPSSESFRPRGLDIYVEGERSRSSDRDFGEGKGRTWRVGVNVHWDVTYDDEYEEVESPP